MRRWTIAALVAVTAVLLGVGLFEGDLETRYGDGGLIEALAAPVDETKPLGPLVWMAGLFALMGPLRPWHRLVARSLAGIAILIALAWVAFGVALSGGLHWPEDEDAVILLGAFVVAGLGALWGFGGRREPAEAEP